jgi:RimJ/RimL family protein N-acetyltransferase
MIKGESINLRPVEHDDLATIESWTNDEDANGSYNMFGLKGRQGLERAFGESGLLDERNGMLLVVTPDGTIVGSMSYHTTMYGPNSGSRTYNIGISLLSAHRGRGYGAEAQRLLAGYLLQTYSIARVEAQTDIANLAEQRALEKAGFTREGVLRMAQWRAGAWHDLVSYSKLRGE